MENRNIDPELVDDRDNEEVALVDIDLPDYDPTQFELAEDFEYTEEEDGDEDGS